MIDPLIYCGSVHPDFGTWCMGSPGHNGMHSATVRDLRKEPPEVQLQELFWGNEEDPALLRTKRVQELSTEELFSRLRNAR